MGKKKETEQRENAASKAYDLHTKAIDDLVNASDENSPEVKEEEIKKFRRDFLGKLPVWLKALFIKFWFNGAICYFFFFGLGFYINNMLDRLAVLSLGMGFMNDIIVKNILLYFDNGNGYESWTLFPYKKFWTLIANIVYSFVLTAFVTLTYVAINYMITKGSDNSWLKVEPVLFALFYLLFDLAFLFFKGLFIKIVADANNKLNGDKR